MTGHRHNDFIRVSGREYPVRDRMRIGRSTYLVLDSLGNASRERLMAFDPDAGFDGQLRLILVLPHSRAASQHVSALRRLPPSPHSLPAVVNYRKERDRILLVLTWIHGPTLDGYLSDVRRERRPRPSVFEAFRLFRGLAHGLSQLHQRCQLYHGDIKPANLILARNPGRLVPIDFGSAWVAERTTARDAGDGISVVYSSPELQARSPSADFRADQFSATVVLYELLTMQLPYRLGGKAGLPEFADSMRGKLIPPSRLRTDRGHVPKYIWDGIDQIVATGLEFAPQDRHSSPSEWRNQVDSVLADLNGRSRLGPFNARLTELVGWFADRFRST